jgi:multimeric flavodoxin WrbA
MADEVLRGAHDNGAATSKIYLDDHRVRPIGEVGDNSRAREDSRRDDDFPKLLGQFLEADVVVWATPVYWHGVSGQMKCFLDRMSCYFNVPPHAGRFNGKDHMVVCAFGSTDSDHGEWVTRPMRSCIEFLRGRYVGEVCASVYEKGAVRNMPDIMNACYRLGKSCALGNL